MVKGRRLFKNLNKRGNILDMLYLMVYIFVISIIFLTTYMVYSHIKPGLDEKFTSDEALNISSNALKAVGYFDVVILMLVIGLVLSVLISAYFIQTHPVFFIVSLLSLIVFMLLTPVLSNVYGAIEQNAPYVSSASQFTLTHSFMDKMPTFFLIFSALIMIVLYAKYKSGGGNI